LEELKGVYPWIEGFCLWVPAAVCSGAACQHPIRTKLRHTLREGRLHSHAFPGPRFFPAATRPGQWPSGPPNAVLRFPAAHFSVLPRRQRGCLPHSSDIEGPGRQWGLSKNFFNGKKTPARGFCGVGPAHLGPVVGGKNLIPASDPVPGHGGGRLRDQ